MSLIEVGLHQLSALSPQLFVLMLEETPWEERRGKWKVLYADTLMITEASKEEAVDRFTSWRTRMEKRGLNITMEKTTVVVTGNALGVELETESYSWYIMRQSCGC